MMVAMAKPKSTKLTGLTRRQTEALEALFSGADSWFVITTATTATFAASASVALRTLNHHIDNDTRPEDTAVLTAVAEKLVEL